MMKRKEFLTKAAITTVGSGLILNSCRNGDEASAPNIQSQKKYRWKMVTTWPPNFPVLGEACQLFADKVKQMSAGRMEIKVYGGGELVPALEVFDAVSSGTAEVGNGVAYYWAGKNPATQFFGAIPFGMNAQMVNSWMLCGGGYDLWRELYSQFNVKPFLGGNTGVQMAGWFNKEIKSIDDLKGLKMRIPGLGGKVLEKAGGTAVLSAGSEIYTNLERGVIDATEWIGPYHDYKMGFHNIARFYYYPGWHEPGASVEYLFNKSKFEALPDDLKAILESAAHEMNQWVLGEFDQKNPLYLQKIQSESDCTVARLPSMVLLQLKKFSKETVDELSESSPLSKKITESFRAFKDRSTPWARMTEKEYYGDDYLRAMKAKKKELERHFVDWLDGSFWYCLCVDESWKEYCPGEA